MAGARIEQELMPDIMEQLSLLPELINKSSENPDNREALLGS